jgi:hypothetical protein
VKVLGIRIEFMNKITIATYRMVPMANDVKKQLTNVALYLATTRIPVLESRLAKRRASAASDILV